MGVSEAGVSALVEHEGYVSHVYLDTNGNPTIGYGHLVQPGEDFSNGVTKEQAQQLFQQDLDNAANAVRRMVTVDLSQPQFDALSSLVYNIGAGNFARSTVLSLVNEGDFGAAADAFLDWSYVHQNNVPVLDQGLLNRHKREAELFRSGIQK